MLIAELHSNETTWVHYAVHWAGFDRYGNAFAFDPGKTCLLEIWDLSEREVDLNEGEVKWTTCLGEDRELSGGDMREAWKH